MFSQAPKINLYRNISITFVVFTILLLVAMTMFFSTKASIIITPNTQENNLSFNVEVKANPDINEVQSQDVVAGYLETKLKGGENVFKTLSTKTVSSDMVGKVTLKNDGKTDQPLLKTTQLQAENGVIVRTNDFVTVPAGGQVEVEVFPKDPESFEPIEPGQLTIIKLNPSLQSVVYGVADRLLTDQPREINVLAQTDIERAKQELNDRLVKELRAEMGLDQQAKLITEIVNYETEPAVGSEVDEFTLKMSVKGQLLKLDEDQLTNLILRKVQVLNLSGLTVNEINISDIDYIIVNQDEAGSVVVKINYELETSLAQDNSLLDETNFLGQSQQAVIDYLSESELIDEVEVLVSPAWRKTLPNSANRIKVYLQ